MTRILSGLLAFAIVCSLNANDARAQQKNATAPFRDCMDCPTMVPIPPGSFTMGVPPGEEERENVPAQFRGWSVPQHRVVISRGFALGKDDITRGEFAAFVQETGYQTGDECYVFAPDPSDKNWKYTKQAGHSWRNPGFAQTDQHPVVCVSWDDAQAYVAWLAKKTGKRYRLPTEAEWEFAARAGSPSARFWGDDRASACRYANVADLTMFNTLNLQKDPERNFNCSDGFTYTAPVGSFEPNGFGLDDVLGNVWQWTEDCWNANYDKAPANGSAWVTGDCTRRVERGGSWNGDPRVVRLGNRDGDGTGNRETNLGFRVARTQ